MADVVGAGGEGSGSELPAGRKASIYLPAADHTGRDRGGAERVFGDLTGAV